jgi:hypothetical protein
MRYTPRVKNKSEINDIKFTGRQCPVHVGFSVTSNQMQDNSSGVVGLLDDTHFDKIHGFHYVSLTRSGDYMI